MSEDNSLINVIAEQAEVLDVVLSGKTIKAMAASLRVSISTVRRWLATKENQEIVAFALHPVMMSVASQAVGAMPSALQVLIDVSQDEDATAAQRVGASKEIIKFGLSLWENITLETRLSLLEQSMGMADYE